MDLWDRGTDATSTPPSARSDAREGSASVAVTTRMFRMSSKVNMSLSSFVKRSAGLFFPAICFGKMKPDWTSLSHSIFSDLYIVGGFLCHVVGPLDSRLVVIIDRDRAIRES